MDKINNISQIVELLRSRVSTNKSSSAKKSSNDKNVKQHQDKSTSALSLDELKQEITRQITSLDPDSKDFNSEASAVFIDNVLCWELGNEIKSDPEYKQLRKKIQDYFLESNQLEGKFNNLFQDILQKK